MVRDRKMKKYCNIIKFLERENKPIYDLFENLCAIGTLNPAKNASGITFIMPNKDLLKKISEAESDGDENAEIYLKSLIITEFLDSPSKFSSKLPIPNRNETDIEVKEVQGKTITLKCGIKLEKNSTFVPFHPDSKLVVYDAVEGSEFPIGGAKVDTRKLRDEKRKKKGGSENNTMREEIFVQIAKEYIVHCKSFENGQYNVPNPFVVSVVSLIEFAKDKPECDVVLSLLDISPEASMYLMLQPFSNQGKFLPTEFIKNWKDSGRIVLDSDKPYSEQYFMAMESAAVKLQSSTTRAKVESIRAKLMESAKSKLSTPANVVNAYKDFAGAYPKAVTAPPQWIDEVRFYVNMVFRGIEDNVFYSSDVENAINRIAHSYPGNNYATECIISPNKMRNRLAANEVFFSRVVGFIASYAFMYLPETALALKNEYGSQGIVGGCGYNVDMTPVDSFSGAYECVKTGGNAISPYAAQIKQKIQEETEKYMKALKEKTATIADTTKKQTVAFAKDIGEVTKKHAKNVLGNAEDEEMSLEV